jgi:hypothetical protein
MFMFQNGLLATFIPEILMVLGYVLCLLIPGFKSHNSSQIDQGSVVTKVISFEQQKQISAYQVSIQDFQSVEPVPDSKQSLSYFIEKAINLTSESHFSTSDGLTYVDFSRPPPFSLS